MSSTPILSPSTETGKLQVMHLKRYWDKALLKRSGILKSNDFKDEWKKDTILLSVLGLGLEQTTQYLFQQAPSFTEFEDWIITVAGMPDSAKVSQFNNALNGTNRTAANNIKKVLTADDWAFWEQNGYLIIRNAVSKENCEKTIEALCNFIEVDRHDASTWYNHHLARQGIMVQLFQHPVMDENRNAEKIKNVYQELWNRNDLWVNADRVGFNPPETEIYKFQGPRLHWDSSIHQPMPFGLQGILYLADTAENQGAFTVIPGFQNKISEWLNSLPEGTNPRAQDLYALGPKSIAANAGDFIVWHHALPHGSSPNTSKLPRFVQYINYEPLDEILSETWL
jgi:ectoine hydroxylase-related dioxygenase (phytanoyl-CoA dioxygenase family)